MADIFKVMTLYVIFSAVAFLILQKQSYTTQVEEKKD